VKITLDLSKLVEQGQLSPVEAVRLCGLAAKDTGSLAINLLVGFGVVAVSAGALALVPRPETALILVSSYSRSALHSVSGAKSNGACLHKFAWWPAPLCFPAACSPSARAR